MHFTVSLHSTCFSNYRFFFFVAHVLATSFCITFNQSSSISSFTAFTFEASSVFWALAAELLLGPGPETALSRHPQYFVLVPHIQPLAPAQARVLLYRNVQQHPRPGVLGRQMTFPHVTFHTIYLRRPFNTTHPPRTLSITSTMKSMSYVWLCIVVTGRCISITAFSCQSVYFGQIFQRLKGKIWVSRENPEVRTIQRNWLVQYIQRANYLPSNMCIDQIPCIIWICWKLTGSSLKVQPYYLPLSS